VWEVDRTIELSKRLLPGIFKSVPDHDFPEKLKRLQSARFDGGAGFARPLSHFAEALRVDLDWIREHTRLGELARRWEARGRPESPMMGGKPRCPQGMPAMPQRIPNLRSAQSLPDHHRAFSVHAVNLEYRLRNIERPIAPTSLMDGSPHRGSLQRSDPMALDALEWAPSTAWLPNWKANPSKLRTRIARPAGWSNSASPTARGWFNAASRSSNPAIWLPEPCLDRSPFRLHPPMGGHRRRCLLGPSSAAWRCNSPRRFETIRHALLRDSQGVAACLGHGRTVGN
jgi:hypothetical protein